MPLARAFTKIPVAVHSAVRPVTVVACLRAVALLAKTHCVLKNKLGTVGETKVCSIALVMA
jgi:hypothetical protein